MAHVVGIVEGPKDWYDVFLHDLEKQQYQYLATHNKTGVIGPMVREIHILDITVPEQNLPNLFADLAPFIGSSGHPSKSKSTAVFLQKAMGIASFLSKFFKGVELKKIPPAKASGEIRRRALNVLPLFWFEDKVCRDEGLVLPMKDGGGELL